MKKISKFCVILIILICLSACSSDDYKAAELCYNLCQIACYSYTYDDASGAHIEGLFEDMYLIDVKSALTAPAPSPTAKPSPVPTPSPAPTAQPTQTPVSTPKPTIKPTNNPSTNSSSSYVAKDREMDAWVCAQDVVEANLKSPSSAKF